jgi:uncharacterized coiled-coil protein SlyX
MGQNTRDQELMERISHMLCEKDREIEKLRKRIEELEKK